MYALFLAHQTKPGRRQDLETVWRQHMLPAITANPGHRVYAYCFGQDADTVCAFQVYESAEEATAFLASPSYQAYLTASRHLLEHDPDVNILDPRWIKTGPQAVEDLTGAAGGFGAW